MVFLEKCFPGLALSSWDYRCEHRHLTLALFLTGIYTPCPRGPIPRSHSAQHRGHASPGGGVQGCPFPQDSSLQTMFIPVPWWLLPASPPRQVCSVTVVPTSPKPGIPAPQRGLCSGTGHQSQQVQATAGWRGLEHLAGKVAVVTKEPLPGAVQAKWGPRACAGKRGSSGVVAAL
jgi:hypothetical protein